MMPTALLRQKVAVESLQGEGASGAVYETPTTHPARVERTRRLVRVTEDAVTVSEATVYLRPDAAVTVGDRVTVSGRTYSVVAVEVLGGLLRTEALRVSLGRSGR